MFVTRAAGFYWVKVGHDPEIMLFSDDRWHQAGSEDYYVGDEHIEVLSGPLKLEEKKLVGRESAFDALAVVLDKAKTDALPGNEHLVSALCDVLTVAVQIVRGCENPLRLTLRTEDEPAAVFEERAQAFYEKTGLIAPGKSLPAEMASVEMEQKRFEAWRAFGLERHAKSIEKYRALVGRIDEFKEALVESAEQLRRAP